MRRHCVEYPGSDLRELMAEFISRGHQFVFGFDIPNAMNQLLNQKEIEDVNNLSADIHMALETQRFDIWNELFEKTFKQTKDGESGSLISNDCRIMIYDEDTYASKKAQKEAVAKSLSIAFAKK